MSIVLGGIWGTAAAIAGGLGYAAGVGTVLGAAVGLVFSPAFIFCGIRSGIIRSALIIGPINLLLVIIVAAISGEAGPLFAMLASVITYVCLCICVGSLRLQHRYDSYIGACPCCGYAYLRHELATTCPDCDEPRPSEFPDPICEICSYSFAGLNPDTCPECGSSITKPSAAAAT